METSPFPRGPLKLIEQYEGMHDKPSLLPDVTDLEHNDEGQPGRQDVPELQSVRVRLRRVWRLPVVPIPGGPEHTGHKSAPISLLTLSQQATENPILNSPTTFVYYFCWDWPLGYILYSFKSYVFCD